MTYKFEVINIKLLLLPTALLNHEYKNTLALSEGIFGSETWDRTKIHGFKGRCPAIRRSRNN
ncbi:MAG: hypothetical protein QG626_543 [Patescibacteria group bacterium]|nr:hypothetical protein [Patescibacteria group bacterium]